MENVCIKIFKITLSVMRLTGNYSICIFKITLSVRHLTGNCNVCIVLSERHLTGSCSTTSPIRLQKNRTKAELRARGCRPQTS